MGDSDNRLFQEVKRVVTGAIINGVLGGQAAKRVDHIFTSHQIGEKVGCVWEVLALPFLTHTHTQHSCASESTLAPRIQGRSSVV